MKRWQKMGSIILAAVLLGVGITAAVQLADREKKDCCLCGSFRCHAPCLVDLETGELMELALYAPHPTLTAELAASQPEQGVFSFVCLADAVGIRETAQRRIQIEVPVARTDTPALCGNCRKLVGSEAAGRYILADLYDGERKTLVAIADKTQWSVRCYEITMTANGEKNRITLVAQGTLKNEPGLQQ